MNHSIRTFLTATAIALSLTPARSEASAPWLTDAPIPWEEDDRRPIELPAEIETSLLWTGIEDTFMRSVVRATDPGRAVRRIGDLFGGDIAPAAGNVNALDETPNSSWFTNRIGLFPLSPEEVARGPIADVDPVKPLTIIRTKSEGVTPGFTVKDARGRTYFIKFDPPGLRGATTGASVVTGRLLYAIGYNVPAETIVRFERSDLTLAPDVSLRLPDGTRRTLTESDVDTLLSRVDLGPEGDWLAIASLLLEGKPLGPFDYQGRRDDDANDRVRHEHRRELRGLRMFAAWLCHFDTKRENTLDMFVEEDGRGYVRHHLLDFASTLGMGANGPQPTYGWEYSWDPPAIGGRLLAFGLHEDVWRSLRRPAGSPQVGYFEIERFDPIEFKPLVPNPAFANFTDRDGYWAAKILSAFTVEQLRAVVAEGRFEHPGSAPAFVDALVARRDRIVREFFGRVPPLDFFRWEGNELVATDLSIERGFATLGDHTWRVRTGRCDAEGEIEQWGEWITLAPAADGAVSLPLDAADWSLASGDASDQTFLAAQFEQVSGADGRSDGRDDRQGALTAYFSPRTRNVVRVQR